MALHSSGKVEFKDALEYVLNGNESEMSDLSSDEDEPEHVRQSLPPIPSLDEEDNSDNELVSDNENETLPEAQSSPAKKHIYRWRKKDLPQSSSTFTLEAEEDIERTPLEYFKLFWTNDLTGLVVENTNLYSTQKSGSSVDTSISEMERYIGMHMKMGIMSLPSYTLYWCNEMRYSPIADTMPLKRFQKLRRYLHFVDNCTYNEEVKDKLFKIRPILEGVRNQCILTKPEEIHSVDEQIIPSKTKFSKIRQYNPKKPEKWGFKNLVRAGSSGIIYDFYLYAGKDAVGQKSTEYDHLQKSAQVVAKLCEDLPSNKGHKLLFDNWFTTLDLLVYLKRRGILACGTIRANRLQGCQLQSNKEIKKSGRGTIDYKSDLNSGVIVAKWSDNNAVHVASNYVGIEPLGTVERWCPEAKERKQIQCPRIIKTYNGGMGGVDLADMLISLYRIPVKTQRWYIKVFWHCIDVAKVNAWLMYRRYCSQVGTPRRRELSLLKFSIQIADALMFSEKAATPDSRPGKVGRPPKKRMLEEAEETSKRGRKPFVPPPVQSARYDQVSHWPEIRSSEKGRCRFCKTGVSRVYCKKCGMCLCLTGQKNCFTEYHTL